MNQRSLRVRLHKEVHRKRKCRRGVTGNAGVLPSSAMRRLHRPQILQVTGSSLFPLHLAALG